MGKKQVYVMQQNVDWQYSRLSDDIINAIHGAVSVVKSGDKVVIKPNFVRQCSLVSNEWEHIVTHPLLIKETLKAVINQLDGRGEIVILDAPQEDSDFDEIVKNTGLKEIIEECQQTTAVPISVVDIRIERKKTCNGIIVKRSSQLGDPKGYVTVDLKQQSSFAGKVSKDYYGADYDREAARRFHNEESNAYVISGSVLDCDVFVNMPKLKTHKIGGMTCCLKNAVGIIGVKNCVPHHTLGSPDTNGDAYPSMDGKSRTENRLKRFAHSMLNKRIPFVGYLVAFGKTIMAPFLGKPMETIRSGHWYGNDTLWRAILDLNKIILYSDREGVMHDQQQRRYVAIVDGIIAGEKNGPMMPEAKNCGIVAVASSPLLGDFSLCRLMGFDYQKIPSVAKGFTLTEYRLDAGCDFTEVEIVSNVDKWNKKVLEISAEDSLRFVPAFGWKGNIELD